MDWKQILVGVVIGAIVGMAGTFFALQGRISKLEGIVEQLKDNPLSKVRAESPEEQYPSWPRSPDKKYQAFNVKSESGEHYQIKEIGTGRIAFTTHAQHDTPNDAKAGLFSSDSKKVAAAYHYGEDEPYTWIGIWDIESGNLNRTEIQHGWTTEIFWIFNN